MLVVAPIALTFFAISVWLGRRYLNDFPTAKPAALRFAAGLGLLLVAAVGAEVLTNFAVGDYHPLTPSRGWAAMITVEELGEMLGGTLMLWGGIELLRAHGLGVLVPLDERDNDS